MNRPEKFSFFNGKQLLNACSFFLAMLFLCSDVCGSPVKERNIEVKEPDSLALHELTRDGDFEYYKPWLHVEQNWFDRIIEWIIQNIRDAFPEPSTFSSTWQTVLLIASAFVLIILFLYLLRQKISPSPKEKIHESNVQYTGFVEKNLKQQALENFRNNDLKNAIRAYFLYSLNLLEDRELIIRGEGKTNRDYLMELSMKQKKAAGFFKEMIKIYQEVYYGEKHPDKKAFDKMEQFILQLENYFAENHV